MTRRTQLCNGETHLWCGKCQRYLAPESFHRRRPRYPGETDRAYLCKNCVKAWRRQAKSRRCAACDHRWPLASFKDNGTTSWCCAECREALRKWRLYYDENPGIPSNQEPGHEWRMRDYEAQVAAYYRAHPEDLQGDTVTGRAVRKALEAVE